MTVLRKIVTEFVFNGDVSKIEAIEKHITSIVNKTKYLPMSISQLSTVINNLRADLTKNNSKFKEFKNLADGFGTSFDKIRTRAKQVTPNINQMELSFTSLAKSMNRAVIIGQSFVAIRLVSYLKRLTASIFTASGGMRQYKIAFETMLGSAEVANDLMERLTQFSLETPFSLESAVRGTKKLMAFGESVDTVVDSLKILGDIQAGTGADISNLILAFGQVKTAKFLRGQELRQFTEAGVPLLDELGKLMGMSPGEVMQSVSKVEVSFELVREALKRMTEEGGRFNNLMSEQTKTLLGWEKLKDQFYLLSVDIGSFLTPAAKIFVNVLRTMILAIRSLGKYVKVAFYGLTALGLAFAVLRAKAVYAAIMVAKAWVLANAPLVAMILLLTGIGLGIGLLIDDIINFFQGKNSAIGIIVKNIDILTDYIVFLFKELGKKIVDYINVPFRKAIEFIDMLLEKISMVPVAIKNMFAKNENLEMKTKVIPNANLQPLLGLGNTGNNDVNGMSKIPTGVNNNNSRNVVNNMATVKSPNINITIQQDENKPRQSLINDVSKGVQNGLQGILNQSLRTMAQ